MNNTNLNAVISKEFIWSFDDCDLLSNFSEMLLSQFDSNLTSSLIQVHRDDVEFNLTHVNSVIIRFHGVGSESSNNVFNLSIYPNFTMVDLGYAYSILTNFLDKDIDISYSDTWTIYSTNVYDFNLTTRTDNYTSSEFKQTEWSNINGHPSYHTIDLNNIFKIEFTNPSNYHQAELWLNVSATDNIDLRLTINGIVDTIEVSTVWSVLYLYTDDLLSDLNTIFFELDVPSGEKIYIQNASYNSNLSLYRYSTYRYC